jgi:transcriptional regulator with GAF, ATPase, and Fis domain
MHSTEPTSSDGRHRAQRLHRYVFLVLEGARLEAGGARVSLADVDELSIGRGDERRLRKDGRKRALDVPDVRMSGVHARLVAKEGAMVVSDAGSTNGTIVNGHAVPSAVLRDGDVFELGQTVFLYREIVDEGPAAGDLDATDKRIQGATLGLATLDPNLARRYDRLARVAAAPLAILLLGETGTGKEVLARAVHTLSKRPGAFVAVNCGAIPHGLVESHLFGHLRGSFSGAVKDEPGLVRSANFGTLLLDEIGDLPPASQAALLRVLQEGEVLPVGSAQPAKVDVRVIGATHKPLDELVERGEFRRDLYARLAGYVFPLSTLRDRKMDLGLLLASFLATGKISAPSGLRLHREAARALLRYDWPMNVRELEQCLRASSVLTDRGVIRVDDLPASVAGALEEGDDASDEPTTRDEELRRELLVRMADARGNVSEVARAMGKARQQVQRWVRRFGIEPEAFRAK